MLVILLLICLNRSIQSQQCLSSPPELTFLKTIDDVGNVIYSGTLRFDAKRFTTTEHGYPTSFTTRVYNEMLPGPTMRFKRGQIYHINLYNDLGSENPNDPAIINTFHHSNTTNLHTHGLHISPELPSDDVTLELSPGDFNTYIYYIPCYHNGGTNFYHPHHHGSAALQVGGGAAGAILIDDGNGKIENLPNWLLSMKELVLMIQFMDLKHLETFTNLKYDKLTKMDASEMFYVINGIYKPTICLNVNEWKLLRIIYSDVTYDTEIKFGDNSQCIVYLIAKDGVYISGPRFLSTNILYFTQSSRVDIAIKCDKIGEYIISGWDHNTMIAMMGKGNINAVNIGAIIVNNVHPSEIEMSESEVVEITDYKPLRQKYLLSLLDHNDNDIDNFWNVRFQSMMQYTLNDELFSGTEAFQIGVNQINEWTVNMEMMPRHRMMEMGMGMGMGGIMGGMHKIHIHVNHFQIMDGSVLSGTDPNFTLIGDWLDSIGFGTRIRFWSDTFGGKIMLHCHILAHEDLGMMGFFIINNGCDALDFECIDKGGSCMDVKQKQIQFVENMENKSVFYKSEWIKNDIYIILLFIFIASIFGCFMFIIQIKRNKKHKSINMNYGSAEYC